MKKGFTLMELSIVLVIVGLLIGGILVGQSLMDSVRLSAQVAQFSQLDIGVANFKGRYRNLPGDAPNFCPGCPAIQRGNGDRMIVHRTDVNQTVMFAGEIGNFWSNAFPDRFKPCTGSGCPVVISGAIANAPAAKTGKNGSFIIASALSSDGHTADTNYPANYYAVLPAGAVSTAGGFLVTSNNNAALRPVDMVGLEAKMDNGDANTGSIISGGIGYGGAAGSGGGITPLAWQQCTTVQDGPVYDINNAAYSCTPLVRIGLPMGVRL